MFTGLIEEEGQIVRVSGISKGKRVEIATILKIEVGDSVAVDGVCLTVEKIQNDLATFFLSKETLEKTKFRDKVQIGQYVNLERAMQLNAFVGGHLVTGHVDTIGKIKSIVREGDSYRIAISYPSKYSKFLVEKGSVAIDGISLTVNEVKAGYFTVQIIPHTFNLTTIKRMYPGYTVNIEFDMIGKYVVKIVENYLKKIRFTLI